MVEIDKKACLKALGELLRAERNNRSLTQAEVAELAGITQCRYSLIENGKRDTEFVVIMKVCKVLNINLSEFIENYR